MKIIKKVVTDDQLNEEAGGLPDGVSAIGVNHEGVMIFQTKGNKSPKGFTGASPEDIVGISRYNAVRNSINEKRNKNIQAGVEVEGIGVFDSDDSAVKRVAGACILALLEMVNAQQNVIMKTASDEDKEALQEAKGSFNEQWITQDNQVVPLDFDSLRVVASAIANHERNLIIAAYQEKMIVKDRVFNSFGDNV